MPMIHAILQIDARAALILLLDTDDVRAWRVGSQRSVARQPGDVAGREREFGAICDAMAGIDEVLVTGAHATMADFHRHLLRHRPELAAAVVGFESADRPSEPQLVALARKYFQRAARADGTARRD